MKKILLIEDDKSLSALIQAKFEKIGYKVAIKGDGENVVKELNKEHPNLVLLDYDLPFKNGIEVLDDIQKEEKYKHLPVIVISNSGDPIDIGQFERRGVKDYLIKAEFDLDELAELVKRYF
ncbi:MAG: hypothetical protein A3C80_03545 [Candidatus Ryanbacteria bacterium RIFCSPHIGHO2_02_FULL_45_43]|uniref:Response regulatory domain-containing protein n=1 Tax=Candidatus Ryanbacteria bacterium RIFCSPHIGHO2_01_45_13 TaxID=1802112 RepID=A0A1G2G1R2_9BACT|nr:MAG: hypothetical protein A2718_03810 [Candidatus Ryanbacteria bacterium RIFCSPHIGHO2_01_FULL_44_130]OGZ43791.1 MAG: hypothetical protein A2W41_00180 [Candidatus Ryanbacteria bacterium RIFCSPHIGHO2_01_45_13]OGZ48001.1 MAG: hypothetical protein A3C80_03545 [Candidatus Ryanbacteria bacterium RIFCSPHIGHO2_02_FULL_45_43]OGZ50137.1 MAG: hypothetical protein A3E55_01410 [Candidatus Ryanbacteria bacterium RIFCSPHIGHO2_12_FULL_44_20]OGZ51139.1 MAG: hypothetical protein A3A17_03850 [Candidatus Ryanba